MDTVTIGHASLSTVDMFEKTFDLSWNQTQITTEGLETHVQLATATARYGEVGK
jgi:hypothetical protein